MQLSTKVAYNTIIQIVSKIIATILGLLAVAVMARSLGRAGFGEYTTIITYLSFFGIAIDFGLTLITSWMISQPGADEKKILSNLFTLRFFSALIFLGISPLVVVFFPYSYSIKMGVAITVFSFFFISLGQILVGFFQTKLRMDKVSVAEVFGRIILLAGVVIAARLDLGLLGFMASVSISSAVSFFIQLFFFHQFIKIRFAFDFPFWLEIIKKSWPLAVTIVFNLLYLKTDILVLSLVKDSKDVGAYGAAYKVIEILTMIPFIFSGIVLPILSSSWSSGNKEYFERVLQKSFDFLLILVIPLIVGTQFLAKEVMQIVAGEEFFLSGPILKILIYATGLVFVSCLFSHVIVAVDKQKKVIGAFFFVAITSVIGYFIFIPKFSYYGAAWVTIYSELSISLFMIFYSMKFTGFLPNIKLLPKIILASAMMAVILYFIPAEFYNKSFNLILALLVSIIVYFIALFILGGLTKKDINSLLNKELK